VRKFFKEFKEFAVKGNVIDLAVGVIIGAAFSKIVSSVVNDIAMPFIGMFIGGIDFKHWVIELPQLFNRAEAITMNLGVFINTVIEFIILSFIIFLFVKAINRIKKKKEDAPGPEPTPSNEEVLLTEIRDLLKTQISQKDK